MAIIVAGRFDTLQQAESVVQELLRNGFHRSDASTFFVNPPGQHDQLAIGGDQFADANASKAHVGAAAGAAAGTAVGAAAALAVPGLGPALALGVVALGAYTGSLAGALAKLGDHRAASESDASPGRHGGMLVAVHAIDGNAEQQAMEILHRHDAADIERQEGMWEDGEWKDFDPVAPPARVTE
jgi:hypothetical protein